MLSGANVIVRHTATKVTYSLNESCGLNSGFVAASIRRCHLATRKKLPNDAAILWSHGCSSLAGECFLEFRHVDHYTVDPVFRRRMRISLGLQPHRFRAGVSAPALCMADKEKLLRSEAVDPRRLFVRRALHRIPCCPPRSTSP